MGLSAAPVLYDQGNDARAAYNEQMGEWREAAYTEAMRTYMLSIEYPRITEYVRFLEGEWWDRRRPKYLSAFCDNKLQYARYAKLSTLTSVKPVIDVFSRVKDFDEQADVAKRVIQHEWLRENLDLSLINVVDAAMLFGNGFWKIGAMTPGFMKFNACGPDMVMPIQPGFHIQDSTAVLYRAYKPLQYFRRLFPERSEGLEQEATAPYSYGSDTYAKPYHVDEVTWQAMSPQMRRKIGLTGPSKPPGSAYGAERYPIIELQEYWVDDHSINESPRVVTVKDPGLGLMQHNYHYTVQPMKRLYPRKRLIVFAGKRLMYDGPSPYWHGQFPFAMLRLNPVLWSFWGLSTYRSLIPLNKAINEVVAGTMDAVKRALNPQMITKEGGVPKAAWDVFFANMPGGKLRMSPTANPKNDIVFMDPPVLPAYVSQILGQYLIPEFDRLSGMVDPNRLLGKEQAPGSDTIERMRDSMNTTNQLESRYIEAFLRDTGYQAISNIFQFYTAGQRLKILGGDGLTWEDFDYDPSSMVPADSPKEDHFKNFALEIAPGSLRGDAKDRDKQVAIALAQMGFISRKELYRRLEIGNVDQIEKELADEHQQMVAAGGDPSGGGRTTRLTRGARNGGI